MFYSHKNIKRFFLEGEIYDDSHIVRLKGQYVVMLENSMRSKGYVPRYDIDPDFTVGYNGKTFEFELSVYGVYVGKKRAQCIQGVDKNSPVKNSSIQKSRSSEVS
jgi:hypothetical protein